MLRPHARCEPLGPNDLCTCPRTRNAENLQYPYRRNAVVGTSSHFLTDDVGSVLQSPQDTFMFCRSRLVHPAACAMAGQCSESCVSGPDDVSFNAALSCCAPGSQRDGMQLRATYCQLHGIVIMCAAGIIPELNTDIREAEVVVVKLGSVVVARQYRVYCPQMAEPEGVKAKDDHNS